MNSGSLFSRLYRLHPRHHRTDITNQRFAVDVYHQLLKTLAAPFRLTEAGRSAEGRPVHHITIGAGPVQVLMWSQMHGNESTASRALLDMLHFLGRPGDEWAGWVDTLLGNITLHLVPMLNPDGSARFQRRNALDIDLNRDARALASPEAVLLDELVKRIKPAFAFNLHDQRRFYNISGTPAPSTIAFLAPASDPEETVPPNRLQAMQVIAGLRKQLEEVIPGRVGLYNDRYTPRAFGDRLQNSGAATILVEAGWQAGDPEKEGVRRLHFALLLSGLHLIAEGVFAGFGEADYRAIPMNDENMFDLLLRGVYFGKGNYVQTDIGIRHSDITLPDGRSWYREGRIEDIGDLREWYGFAEPEVAGLYVKPGKTYTQTSDIQEDIHNLLKQGFLFVADAGGPCSGPAGIPINLLSNGSEAAYPGFEQPANLLLTTRAGELRYVVMNGYLWEPGTPLPEEMGGVVM